MRSKSITKVSPTEILKHSTDFPTDYHCDCEYCKGNFLGDIRDGKLFYHAKAKETYFPKANPEDKHLDAGHFQGYRWAIHNFTQPGDWILDPTVGTGTAIVEAINNGRNAIGIELEYPHIAQANIDAQKAHATGQYLFRQGNAKVINEYLDEWGVEKESLSLIVNGTPYPTLGAVSSDSPERVSWNETDGVREYHRNENFDYNHEDNIGKKKGDEYWNLVNQMYSRSIDYLKPKGYFITIIKDMTRNKQPYLLHKMVIDSVLNNNPGLEYFGSYVHKHWPPTLHMLTYPKKFPEVKLPSYQTAIILRKK
jgi:hypothetical protein